MSDLHNMLRRQKRLTNQLLVMVYAVRCKLSAIRLLYPALFQAMNGAERAATSQCATSHGCGFGAAWLQHGINATPSMTGAPGSDPLRARDDQATVRNRKITRVGIAVAATPS